MATAMALLALLALLGRAPGPGAALPEPEASEEPPGVGRTAVQPPRAPEQPNATSGYEEYCLAPQVTGPCRAAFPRWYHDPATRTCRRFTYGGCRGNKNNHLKEEICLSRCRGAPEPETSEEPLGAGRRVVRPPGASGTPQDQPNATSSYAEYCLAPQVTGPCRAAFPRWYHDPATRTCRRFTYGGCHGNKNNHLEEGICLSRCRWPPGASGDLDEGGIHSTRAIALAVLLALMAAVLLGSVVAFFAKLCRKGPERAVGPGWSPLNDKEHLMTSAYVL